MIKKKVFIFVIVLSIFVITAAFGLLLHISYVKYRYKTEYTERQHIASVAYCSAVLYANDYYAANDKPPQSVTCSDLVNSGLITASFCEKIHNVTICMKNGKEGDFIDHVVVNGVKYPS